MRKFIAFLISCLPIQSTAQAAVDVPTAEAVIQRCISIYKESGHPCACPFDLAKNGSRCGLRSAHDRPRGAEPICLVTEVTPELAKDLKTNTQALIRQRCHYHGR